MDEWMDGWLDGWMIVFCVNSDYTMYVNVYIWTILIEHIIYVNLLTLSLYFGAKDLTEVRLTEVRHF